MFKGDWNKNNSYKTGDIVMYDNKMYYIGGNACVNKNTDTDVGLNVIKKFGEIQDV